MILVRAAAITDNDATVASDRGAGKPLTKFKGLGAWDGFRRGEMWSDWEESYED